MNEMTIDRSEACVIRPARLGFLGVGWIGRNRMQTIVESGLGQVAAIADPSAECISQAASLAPAAKIVNGLDALLAEDLDGIVIATPSAQHAEQSLAVLRAGMAVFCQKPLGRSAEEVSAVVAAARQADRLLGVDLSYRYTRGMQQIRELISSGALGNVFALDLTFHNAYGPDKPWFYDRTLSGGGCLIDLGIHLVDLALWALSFPEVVNVNSTLLKDGRLLSSNANDVEDFALATLTLETGAVVRIACSWRLQAGCDAAISADIFGTKGGASFRNRNGSFYDFDAHRFYGTKREVLTEPPDEWGGRAAVDWARKLSQNATRFDPECENLGKVAKVLDRIYGYQT
ncbi:Gfo/Idh/MocA family protein [Oryzifoliimicrobium ureilyticus]|uniref:Gfo/Idh/MocA family protein n=1 Tax=Oryzifoliimicrobium ureilyticus TaxID=3113724 RepID=UPI0030762128